MSLFIEGNLKHKKWRTDSVNQFSGLVTSTGFKPVTLRAEI